MKFVKKKKYSDRIQVNATLRILSRDYPLHIYKSIGVAKIYVYGYVKIFGAICKHVLLRIDLPSCGVSCTKLVTVLRSLSSTGLLEIV